MKSLIRWFLGCMYVFICVYMHTNIIHSCTTRHSTTKPRLAEFGFVWNRLCHFVLICKPSFTPIVSITCGKRWLAKGGKGHKKEVSVKNYGSQRWEGTENVELREEEKHSHCICASPSVGTWLTAQFFSVLLP